MIKYMIKYMDFKNIVYYILYIMDKKTKLICILGFVLLTFSLILGYTFHVKEGVTNMDEILQKWTSVDGEMKYTKHVDCSKDSGKVYGKDNMGLGADLLGKNCYDDNGLVNDWKYFMKPLISGVSSVSQCKKKCQERKNCKGFTYDKNEKHCYLFSNYPLTVTSTTKNKLGTYYGTAVDIHAVPVRGAKPLPKESIKNIPNGIKVLNERCKGNMVNYGNPIAVLVNKDNRGADLNSNLPKVSTVDRKNTRNIAMCIKACRGNPNCKSYSYITDKNNDNKVCIMFNNLAKEKPDNIIDNVRIEKGTGFPSYLNNLTTITDNNLVTNGCDSQKIKGDNYINGTKLFCGQIMKENYNNEQGKAVTNNISNWGGHPNNLYAVKAGGTGETNIRKKLLSCQKQCNENSECLQYTWIPYSRTSSKKGYGDCFLFSKNNDWDEELHELKNENNNKYGYSNSSIECISKQSGTKYANKYDCWDKKNDKKGRLYRGKGNRWAIKDPITGDITKEGICLSWTGEPNKQVGCGDKGKACTPAQLKKNNQKYPLGSPPYIRYANLPKNYCRNPGGGENLPWCYTSDPTVRWANCQTSGKKRKEKVKGGVEICENVKEDIVKKTYEESIIQLEKTFKNYPCYPHCNRDTVDSKDDKMVMNRQIDILNVMNLDVKYHSAFILINDIDEQTTKGVYLLDINSLGPEKENVLKPIMWKNIRNGNVIEAYIERYNTGIFNKVTKWVLKSKGQNIAETDDINGEWSIIGDNILSGSEISIKYPRWNREPWISSANEHISLLIKNIRKQQQCRARMKSQGIWKNDFIGGENWESDCSYPKTPNTIGTDRMTLSTIDTLTMEKDLIRLLERCASKDGTIDDCERARIVSELK